MAERKKAENALCDLHLSAAIQAICESSSFRSAAGKRFAARIAKLCQEHGSMQLRAYERAGGAQ